MANAGQAVLGVAGAAVGWFVGGPTGAAWGWQLGMAAGSAAFPTDLGTISGPRLDDLTVQSSAIGAPIPLVYGTYALSGNLIWSSGIIETVSKKKQGGKGGPTQTTKTYTYKVNCAIGVCEGPISGIIRIWADAKLIFDARPQLDGESAGDFAARQAANAALLANMEVYLGDETQLADPTIESFEGAGNVAAYRGLAYVVFSEFQLGDYGNRIPNYRFEVASLGIVVDECTTITVADVGEIPAWTLGGQSDPRVNGYTYEYNQSYRVNPSFNSSLTGGWTSNFSTALSALSALDSGRVYAAEIYQWTGVRIADSGDPDAINGYRYPQYPCNTGVGTAAEDSMYIDIFINSIDGLPSVCAVGGEGPAETLGLVTGSAKHIVPSATGTFNPGIYQIVGWVAPNTIGGVPAENLGGVNWNGTEFDDKLLGLADNVMKMRRVLQAPPSPCFGEPPSDIPGYCFRGGFYIPETASWAATTTPVKGIKVWEFSGTAPYTSIQQYAIGPFLAEGDANYNNQAWWEAAYAEAVANGDAPSGWTYGAEYPREQATGWSISYEQCTFTIDGAYGSIPLGTIVRDLCLRAGLADEQIDVTDLTELVFGYAVGRVMTAKDAISPLRSYGLFDCIESDDQLQWPKRGKAPVRTLTTEDLAAHISGEARPTAAEISRAQTAEVPNKIRLHYCEPDQNYETAEQTAARINSGSEAVQDIELAIAMTATKAAQLAEIFLYDAWVSRNTYKLTLAARHLDLVPADVLLVPVEGRVERMRFTTIEYALPGLLAVEALRDDDGAYTSYAVGIPSAGSGQVGSTITTRGTAELVLLDLPLLQESDNDAGIYAAIYADGGNNWSGAVLLRSADGGTSYSEVASMAFEATVGSLDDALPAGPTTVIDDGNELIVTLAKGELESVTEASLLAGANAAAIGANGRWEVIQFMDAELIVSSPQTNTWRLTGLARGRRGTEWAVGTSVIGDAFVLLDAAVFRVPLSTFQIGVPLIYNPVLVGNAISNLDDETFTGNGVALRPFSGAQLESSWSGDDLIITWQRRDRLGQELQFVPLQMSEASELYEVDIYDGPSVVRTLVAFSPSVTYTSAQQTADFGSPVPGTFAVKVYQMSAVVGRGYELGGTV